MALAGGFLDDSRVGLVTGLQSEDAENFDRLRITDLSAPFLSHRDNSSTLGIRALLNAPLVSIDVKEAVAKQWPTFRDELHLFNSARSTNLSATLLALARVNGHHAKINETLRRRLLNTFYWAGF
ncbi:MAG: hypothetical protein EOP10_31770 [Proteobacteria bacterium]|nr:MAG: hypothetical protein EOP10_31770 [Pseudomonadota bacterium]